MKLKEIASVQSGIYEQPKPFGDVYYIQARHFDLEHKLVDSLMPELPLSSKLENHFLEKGDVIIASKGTENFAVAYQERIHPVVASSTFLVIRLRVKEEVVPEYVSWFLNLRKTQLFLRGRSKGTSIPSITKSDVENIDIPLPSVETQKLILRIEELLNNEKVLRRKIESLKDSLIQQKLLNALK
ncbi:MAG: restriction endonuclease subunit S [Ignavibacteria bacterium]|nr:restriction endonuclease subunit S [Ignavibacteria bacterium]